MRPLRLFTAFCLGVLLSPAFGTAQEPHQFISTGYVTEVRGPKEFALNRQVIKTDSATDFRYMNGKGGDIAEITRKAMQVGAYLEVKGSHEPHSHALRASEVLLRDDLDKELGGFGVIEKVESSGAEPVFLADGYAVRVTAKADVSLGDGVKSLSDVGANCWIRFRGTRDTHGILVARQAKIVAPRTAAHRGAKQAVGQLPVPKGGALLDIKGNLVGPKTKVNVRDAGGACGWRRAPEDAVLQERVQRVGMRVVPAYQKALQEDDPTKIPFRFYVVEEKSIRPELVCAAGLIEVPRPTMERLASDDQLAAVLADGVAFHLQRQSSALQSDELQGAVMFAAAAAGGVSGLAGEMAVEHELRKRAQEERGRIALALMAEGGFDPWQAPEAWRLLAEKKPKQGSPVYPDQSEYQLGILNLQYRGIAGASGGSEVTSAEE